MEKSKRALRVAIVAQWVLIVAGVGFGIYEEGNLPEALKHYITEQDNKEFSATEMVAWGSAVFLLVGLLLSSIGIYRMKSWARTLYVACSILITFIFLFLGPVVRSPIEGTLEYLANAIEGFAVALMYFSLARECFERSATNNSEISNKEDAPDLKSVR